MKAGAGSLVSLNVVNFSGNAIFLQVFDATTANVTLATTSPDDEMYLANGASAALPLPSKGLPCVNAITIAATTAEKGNISPGNGVQAFYVYA